MPHPVPSPEESHRALEKILSESPSDNTELPNLAPPSWTNWFHRTVDSFFDFLHDSLRHLFGKDHQLAISPESLERSITILFYVVVIVIAAWVVSVMVRSFSARARAGGADAAGHTPPPLSERELNELIDEALKNGDIPRATRLLWRGFIIQWDMAPNTTPHEYRTVYPEKLPVNYIERLYALMYSGAAIRSEFDACRQLLQEGVRDAVV